MSEVQFSRLISSLNTGSGTPCTIKRIDGEYMPDVEPREKALDKHDERIDKFQKEVSEIFEPFIQQIQGWKDSKKRPTLKELEELAKQLKWKSQAMGSNAQFIHDTLAEAADETVNAAKAEIEAHVQTVVTTTGLEAIKEQAPRIGGAS
jgi:hypothetical protein